MRPRWAGSGEGGGSAFSLTMRPPSVQVGRKVAPGGALEMALHDVSGHGAI